MNAKRGYRVWDLVVLGVVSAVVIVVMSVVLGELAAHGTWWPAVVWLLAGVALNVWIWRLAGRSL